MRRAITRERTEWTGLPYLEKFSIDVCRTPISKLLTFRLTSYSLSTVRKLFGTFKDLVSKNERGIYEIRCGDCEVVYVSETGRKLQICVEEHFDLFHENHPKKSTFVSHLLEFGHSKNKVKLSSMKNIRSLNV